MMLSSAFSEIFFGKIFRFLNFGGIKVVKAEIITKLINTDITENVFFINDN